MSKGRVCGVFLNLKTIRKKVINFSGTYDVVLAVKFATVSNFIPPDLGIADFKNGTATVVDVMTEYAHQKQVYRAKLVSDVVSDVFPTFMMVFECMCAVARLYLANFGSPIPSPRPQTGGSRPLPAGSPAVLEVNRSADSRKNHCKC